MNKLRLLFKHFAFNFIRRYRRNPASRWTILVIDLFALLVAFAVTDLFRLRMSDFIDWPSLIFKYCFFGVIATIFYLIIGTYRSIIRHGGMYDIYKVLISNGAAALLLIAFNLVNNNHPIVTNRPTEHLQRLHPPSAPLRQHYHLRSWQRRNHSLQRPHAGPQPQLPHRRLHR